MPRGAAFFCLLLSAGLLGASDETSAGVPSVQEQTALVLAVREAAVTFSDTLPNFICTQVTRRWTAQVQAPSDAGSQNPERARFARANQSPYWQLKDTLTVELTFLNHKERYKLLQVNGKTAKRSYESVGGATFYGDLWNALGVVFQPSSHARFQAGHWVVLNGTTVLCFPFQVTQAHSQWRLASGRRTMLAGFTGSAYIEPVRRQILELRMETDPLPKEFPIQKSGIQLDFGPQTVGTVEYLLPVKAVEWNRAEDLLTRNEVAFRSYRKFGAESKLNFETETPFDDQSAPK